jgi:hypothetical protein
MTFEIYAARAAEHAREDVTRRKAAAVAEPLISGLARGRNYFAPRQFAALARYLLEDPAKAIDAGLFSVGSIELVRAEGLREDRLITVSALARIAGVPRRTLARQVASLNLKFVRRGDEKLYDIDALRSVLAKADVEQ